MNAPASSATPPLRIFLAGQKQFGRDVLAYLLTTRHEVVGVSAPLLNAAGDNTDRLRDLALEERLPTIVAGTLTADTLPAGVDLLIAAHSHDFIGRRTRAKLRIGAIGYHPSLLPRHRGRDAVRWTIAMKDPIAGGTVFWLSDTVDGGDIAAQDWCHVRPDDDARSLWRRELAPMGVRLLGHVVADLGLRRLVRIPQDPALVTWEPSWERPPLRRPDLLMLGDGTDRFRDWTVVRERAATLTSA